MHPRAPVTYQYIPRNIKTFLQYGSDKKYFGALDFFKKIILDVVYFSGDFPHLVTDLHSADKILFYSSDKKTIVLYSKHKLRIYNVADYYKHHETHFFHKNDAEQKFLSGSNCADIYIDGKLKLLFYKCFTF